MAKQNRLSNYELLRIYAMILIIISHVYNNAINVQLFNNKYSTPGELFNNLVVYKRLIITYYGGLLGQVGNTIFFLISGYFLIEKEHIDLVKQIKKILSQALYVTISLTLLSVLFIKTNIIKTNALSLDQFNNGWWFVALYVFTLICAEIFINKLLHKMNKQEYTMCLLICYSLVGIGFLRGTINQLASGLEYMISCVFIYILGGYLKIYNPLSKMKSYFLLILLIATFGILAISYYNYSINNVNQAILDSNKEFIQVGYGYISMYTLPCIIVGTINFELFRRLKIKSNKILNYVASTTFMMYLIHETPFVRELFMKIKWNYILYNREYIKLCIYIGLIIISIVLSGVIFYSVYKLLITLANKRLQNSI